MASPPPPAYIGAAERPRPPRRRERGRARGRGLRETRPARSSRRLIGERRQRGCDHAEDWAKSLGSRPHPLASLCGRAEGAGPPRRREPDARAPRPTPTLGPEPGGGFALGPLSPRVAVAQPHLWSAPPSLGSLPPAGPPTSRGGEGGPRTAAPDRSRLFSVLTCE